jgi:hypothetical protein
VDDLKNLPDEVGFPQIENNEDNEADMAAMPNVTVKVKNVTDAQNSQDYRGAYFRYNYLTGSWEEVMLGTHSHENKDVLDKITSGDIGSWEDLSQYPSTIHGLSGTSLPTADATTTDTYFLLKGASAEDPRALYIGIEETDIVTNYSWQELEKNTNTLFVDTTNYLLYKAVRTVTNGVVDMAWISIPMTYGVSFPFEPNIKDAYYRTDLNKLYVFAGAKAGDRKMLTLEVTDPDNSEFTYSYDVAWMELPENMPIVPEDVEAGSYLGLDSANKPVWKNSFAPTQVFQVKRITIVSENPGIDEEPAGTILHVADVDYDASTDEVLVMDGNFFLHNRDIIYDSNLRVLEVHANEGSFDVGEIITVIIIRNGTAAIMDQLAADYVTKADAISLLSGGSVNLRNYATKTDLQTRALKDHYHSEYARHQHDHDYRYANFKHTHDEYLTRRKVLELIQERLQMDPNTLDILQQISDYLAVNQTGLYDFINGLNNVAGEADIDNLQAQIDALHNTYYDQGELTTFVNSYIENYYGIRTYQIRTEYIDTFGVPKNLTQVLQEIKDDIDGDLRVIDSENVTLNSPIEIELGPDGYVGDWDTGESIPEGMTLQAIIEKIVRRKIEPTYEAPEVIVTFDMPELVEIGETITATINSLYEINDGGSLDTYKVELSSGLESNVLLSSNQIEEYTGNITFTDEEATISVYATYNGGPTKYDNLGNAYPDERILAGTTEIIEKVYTPVRGIFYGSLSTVETINSTTVRSVSRYLNDDYTNFEIDYTIPVGSRMIIFALPTNEGTLDEIQYREQFYADILPNFTVQQITVEGANGATGIIYNVYSYTLPFANTNKMHLKFIK